MSREGGLNGTSAERSFSLFFQIASVVVSLLSICFYVYQYRRKNCGWEVIFVASVELARYALEIPFELDTPAMIYLTNGLFSSWIRYCVWLMTCPVLLIHLSNLTGLNEEYSPVTMRLLINNQATILFGFSATLCKGQLKVFFFLLGMLFGGLMYKDAYEVYAESHHVVPNQHKNWIIAMGTIFFCSWAIYPILFIFGQEGFRLLSHPLVNGMMGAADLISKNLWGFMGWKLRRMLFRFIAEYGNPHTVKLAQEHRLDLTDLYYNDGQGIKPYTSLEQLVTHPLRTDEQDSIIRELNSRSGISNRKAQSIREHNMFGRTEQYSSQDPRVVVFSENSPVRPPMSGPHDQQYLHQQQQQPFSPRVQTPAQGTPGAAQGGQQQNPERRSSLTLVERLNKGEKVVLG